MTEFRVGDRVRFISTSSFTRGVQKGDLATVVEESDGVCTRVRLDDSREISPYSHRLELANVPNPKFAPGVEPRPAEGYLDRASKWINEQKYTFESVYVADVLAVAKFIYDKEQG